MYTKVCFRSGELSFLQGSRANHFEGTFSEAHAGNAMPWRFSGVLEDDACHWERD
jgi:hypothetical protein